MDELKLTTDSKMRRSMDIKMLSVLFVILSAVCWFIIGKESFGAFIGTVVILFLALAWTYFRSAKNGDVTLYFKGDCLEVQYGDGRKYSIKDVDRSFFSLVQSEKEKSMDMGTLSVQSTNFRVKYINNFSAMREYIETHFEPEQKSIYYLDDEDDED